MINKQDYINSIYQNIEMVRGDTLSFNFMIEGADGTPTFAFVVADEYGDSPVISATSGNDIVLEATSGQVKTYSVSLRPAQTSGLATGIYYYNLVMYLNSETYTLMRGEFNILYEVKRG